MKPDDENDTKYMRRALELSARGPEADPNPRVGAVLVDRRGTVVGEGFHRGAGTPHAEADALAQGRTAARDGTMYVTLEPCNHYGRTGPCTEALIDAGVARVVLAHDDPNPSASGGVERLRAAGIRVDRGTLAEEALSLNRTWAHLVTTGRPFVTWKFAATLDGRSAAADGTSQWITSQEARADVHDLRSSCGAIIVGTGTVLADDPHLTARRADVPLHRQPLRVVLGERAVPHGARVLDEAAPTRVVASHDVHGVLRDLGRDGIHHALLEGGATLASAFLQADLVDEVIAYLAPALLGAGTPAVADFGVRTLAEIRRLRPTSVAIVGADIRITATPAPRNQESH